MKRVFAALGLGILLLTQGTAFAQTEPLVVEIEPLEAIISGPDDIAVGRTVVLDALATKGLGEETQYRWYLNDTPQPVSRTVEAVYTPEEPGVNTIRLVITTTVNGEDVEVETERVLTVYARKIVLIAEPTIEPEKLLLHQRSAAEAGVFLRVLQPSMPSIPLDSEESLVDYITEQMNTLAGADAIVLWVEGITGLQALMRAVEAEPDRVQNIEQQSIILITNRSLPRLARTARGPFSVLQPDRILVTRKEAINPLFSTPDVTAFMADLEQRDIDFVIVDESTTGVRPWNLLSSLVNYMLTHGVSSQTIILLLTLPVIATILAFLKQVIGITTFGLYTPSIVALSFLALGWKIGLLFLVSILVSSYATRAAMRRWRLLYIPKVAIIITVVSLTVLILLGIGAYYDLTLSRDTIFVLLIMSTLAESFLNVKTEEGWRSAILGIGETILAALLCVFIVQWSPLQSLVLAYPELVLLTIVFNALLGRWTGLRLVEFIRFREVFRHLQEEE